MSPEISRMLAIKKQYAVVNRDDEMIKKIQNVKKDSDVTEEMRNYKLKTEE